MQNFTLRDRQKLRRKDRIFSAAIELFRERGFMESTATDIAIAAQVSRGTFFNYFPYKEAVLLYLGESMLRTLHQQTTAWRQSQHSSEDVLQHFWQQLAQTTQEQGELMLPLVYEMLNPDPERAQYAYQHMPLVETLAELLSPFVGYGLRVDLASAAKIVADGYLVTVLRHATSNSNQPLMHDMNTYLSAVLKGLLTSRPA